MKKLLTFSLFMIFCTHIFGQSSATKFTISGVLTDEQKKEPLIGASISVKGTNKGTVTDIDGQYTLEIDDDQAILIVAYLGYETKEINVAGQKIINISLNSSNVILNQVVVIGYGQQQKKDLTTAVATLTARDIKDQPVNSFDQALMGKLAGVQVQQNSGSPGAGVTVRVRGTGSITAGNDPLYVIDGVPISNDNNRATGQRPGSQYSDNPINVLATLNPTDIESIQVLKDASAAAIYGSRGSSGVILITTKKGAEGKPIISYNTYFGIQEANKKIDMLDAYEWAQMNFEGRNNAYRDRFPNGKDTDDSATRAKNVPNQPAVLIPTQVMPYLENKTGLTNTDWQDAILRKAPIQSHSLSISGGTPGIKYYISGDYMNQEGIVIGSGFKRYGGRFNLDINHNKLKVGLNINPSLVNHDIVNSEGPWFDESVIGMALSISPIWPVYNQDGGYNFDANAWGFAMTNFINPVALANEIDDNLNHLRLLANTYAEYSILKNLSYRLSLGTDINNFNREYYRPSNVEAIGIKGAAVPIGSARNRFTTNWLVENTLNYNTKINKHNISAIAGFSSQREDFSSTEVQSNNFPNDLVRTLNAGQVTLGSSFKESWSLLSGLGRVQYNYDDRYYVSLALRADGSSRFGTNNKWGYFPSASAAWRITSEPFMKDVQAINTLKLRASYGVTGNFQIPNYGSIGLLSFDNYVLGGTVINNGLAPSTPSNPDLSWERTNSYNLGLDLGLLKDALFIEFEAYNARTTDLLLNVPVPMSSGFSTELRNIGEIENRGIETTITFQQTIKKFNFSLSGNIAANRNKVISLAPGVPELVVAGGVGTAQWITKPGLPIGSYFNPVYDGVFNSVEEIKSVPAVGNARPGDFKYLDINGDGKIDFSTDREVQGSFFPNYTYGLNLNVGYSNFDISASLQGAQGQKIMNLMRRYIHNSEGNMNLMQGTLERWISPTQPGNGQTNRANRLATGSNGQTSNWHLEDGSFTRIRNLTLGYSVPKSMLNQIKVNNLRAYFTVQNPFTFTKYLGYNPEVNSRPDNALTPGEDYATYPLARTYTVGVNLSF